MTTPLPTKMIFVACSVVYLLASQASFAQCTQTLSAGANVASAVSSAANGSTICLNSGTYSGTALHFDNINRTGFVTVRSVAGVGAQLISPEVLNSKFIKFDSLTLTTMLVGACSTNIHILNSTFVPQTEHLAFNYDTPCPGVTDMALVVDGNTFDRGQPVSFEGRVSIRGVRGIILSRNAISNNPTTNASDGIQIVGNSTNVTIGPGNVFSGILQSSCGAVHCDAIQAFGGGANTVISGNYFINCSVYIGFYDGGSPNTTIKNNLFDTNPGGQVLQIGGIQGMLMEHNTFVNSNVGVGTKFADPPNSGWTVQNNIFDNADFTASGDQPGCGVDCTMRHNLKSRGGATTPTGTNNVTGNAVYLGAGSPSQWGNWRLASGSPGKNAGNDGQDMGSNYFGPLSAPKNLRKVQ